MPDVELAAVVTLVGDNQVAGPEARSLELLFPVSIRSCRPGAARNAGLIRVRASGTVLRGGDEVHLSRGL